MGRRRCVRGISSLGKEANTLRCPRSAVPIREIDMKETVALFEDDISL